MSKYGYSTLAVHAGQHPDPQTGSVTVPLYLTSTFELTGIGTDRGWDYSRAGNPTRDRLETALAALEGGHSGHAFTTGMAALSALFAMLRAGDHLLCSKDVYAGTVRLLDRIVSGYGIAVDYVDTSDLKAVEAALRPNTRLVHIETPSNPLMVLTDNLFFRERRRIVEPANRHRLPQIFDTKDFVESGGLMSYGADLDDLYRRAAAYVDKILKGARPATLPVEQATKFELLVNMKTAKALDLTIPQSVLLRADKIVE